MIWLDVASTRNNDFSSLEVIQVGGAKFSAEVAKRIRPTFGCTLQQVFGMAEGLVNYTRLNDSEEVIIHTQGRPMSTFDEVRVVDENDNNVKPGEVGRLLTRGHIQFVAIIKQKSIMHDHLQRMDFIVQVIL